VNGWQQGWLLPAGQSGSVTLDFASNTLYRTGLFGGLALLPLLALLALWPTRKPRLDVAARPWRVPPVAAAAAALAVCWIVSGWAGLAVIAACIGVRHLLRNRPIALDRTAMIVSSGGLILAGATLSQNPWRSVDGYVGHFWGVQLLALVAVAMLAASAVWPPADTVADGDAPESA
jgi:arabinofuranan 3-O-arabinosyltransferase